jgi:hypothetical protein
MAENVHGVGYMLMIADSNSSVYSKVVKSVPIWGRHVQKLLRRTCARKTFLQRERLTYIKNIVRLTTTIRCAIRMQSKETHSSY